MVHSALQPVSTKDWLIEFHQQVPPEAAKRIAKRYAMVSRGPVRVRSNEQRTRESFVVPGHER
jgi:hypothetical protein